MQASLTIQNDMNKLYTYIPHNTQGKDYICADIHGHFSLLESIMKRTGFNKNTDRLFSLGDLIDRGPESDLALEWLNQEWFYAIQGNHERMLINAVEQQSENLMMQWLAWGGAWAEELSPTTFDEFYARLSQLPVTMELELANGKRVGLVHAELPDICDWNDVKQTLHDCPRADIEKNLFVSDMLWYKSQPYRSPEENHEKVQSVRNIDHVFHGHTIIDFYLTITNRTFMDLGSYLNDDIGFIEPLSFLTSNTANSK